MPPNLNSLKLGARGQSIKRAFSTKYLGVIPDEDLSWREHITEIKQKLVKLRNSYKIIRHYVGENNKYKIYHAYTYSKLLYGIEVYGQANKTTMQPLQIQQNRSIKVLFNKEPHMHTSELYKTLKLLQIRNMYNVQLAQFVYKHQNNLLPSIFEHYFTTIKAVHNHHTRSYNKLYIPNPINEISKKSIKYMGANVWNSLPKDVHSQTSTLSTFKRKLKSHLISVL